MTDSGQIPASPPAGFPVYGLEESWQGARWLDSFGDRIGDQVRWVRLAHQSEEPEAFIMVVTQSRPLTDAQAALAGEPALRSVAFDIATVLVDLTLPEISVTRPDGLVGALVGHADERSRQYASWPPVSWRVDGATAHAKAWRFAGGWAAISDALDGVYLAAAGLGAGPDGLALAALEDGRGYHFGLHEPLHPQAIAASDAAARPGAGQSLPRSLRWHPDQLRLMPGR